MDIPCPVYQAWVNTCTGQYYIVPPRADAICSPVLSFARDCCGQICIVNGTDRCTHLEIQPVQCTADVCP